MSLVGHHGISWLYSLALWTHITVILESSLFGICINWRVQKAQGGYSDIFIHMYRLGSFILGFRILNLNIFGGFQKNNIFGGMKILWIFFWVITKLDYT